MTEPMAHEYEQLGRYLADFSILEMALTSLCAALVAPRDGDLDAFDRAGMVASEVDVSRRCDVVTRLIESHADANVRALVPDWSRARKRIHREIDWRNDVAHSRWTLALSDSGIELWKARRGTTTSVTTKLIEGHRKSVSELSTSVFDWMTVARPSVRVDVTVEPSYAPTTSDTVNS